MNLNDKIFKNLSSSLKDYNFKFTVPKLSGLLTLPSLQANNFRIELLVHLAVIHCKGRKNPSLTQLTKWLNDYVENTEINLLEDPAENVFVTNIETHVGNFRIFEGTWISNNYSLQVILDTIYNSKHFHVYNYILKPAIALLMLSDEIANRSKLKRWHFEESLPQNPIDIFANPGSRNSSQNVTFSEQDLYSIGLNKKIFEPFIFAPENRSKLQNERFGNSSLERSPLIDFQGNLVFALPNATSISIRRYILSSLKKTGDLKQFNDELSIHQFDQLNNNFYSHFQPNYDKNETPQIYELTKHLPNDPSLSSTLFKYDIDKYIHIVLFHDQLDIALKLGLESTQEYDELSSSKLISFTSAIKRKFGSKLYHTMFIIGGIGRGFNLCIREHPEDLNISILQISELLYLAGESGSSIIKFLKCMEQKNWAENEGIQFIDPSTDYNFYCYWRRHNYCLIPPSMEIKKHNFITIASDYIAHRKHKILKQNDPHVLQTTSGTYTKVTRLNTNSYFKSLKQLPIYFSIDHVRSGKWEAVIKSKSNSIYWITINPTDIDQNVKDSLFHMWTDVLKLFHDVLIQIETNLQISSENVFEIRLNFEAVLLPTSFKMSEKKSSSILPKVNIDLENHVAEIIFHQNFLLNFTYQENIGERLLLSAVTESILCLNERTNCIGDRTNINQYVESILSDPGARVLHIPTKVDEVQYILSNNYNALLTKFSEENFVFSKLNLSKNIVNYSEITLIETRQECKNFLNKLVDRIWERLQKQLNELDRTSVLCRVLEMHESILWDRYQWKLSSKALNALYGPDEQVVKVALEQEHKRSKLGTSARTILEMAICECPNEGGRRLSKWDLDDLIGNASLLLEVAHDSDAIYKSIINPPNIELHQNGEYSINRDYLENFINPFFTDSYTEYFEKSVTRYSQLYQSKNSNFDNYFSKRFLETYSIEFGLTVEDVYTLLKAIVDLAVTKGSNIIETTVGDFISDLAQFSKLSTSVCNLFLNRFSIEHRPNWDQVSDEFKLPDIYPWRFNRRLSITVRPILVFGKEKTDKVIIGLGTLQQGIFHTLDAFEKGKFPNEFFHSTEMKQYVGSINDKKGHQFTRQVAETLSQRGWKTKTEVELTQLGANTELGDIDVLAWNAQSQCVKIIECKKLRFARTIYEIAEICDRFKGNSKDELAKHLARIDWLLNDLDSLKVIVGFTPEPKNVEDYLVTNIRVPIMYLEDLPISQNKIKIIDDLI